MRESVATDWASGHPSNDQLASVLENGKPRLVASCYGGYGATDEQCPDPRDDAETKAIAHWSTNPKPYEGLPVPHASGLWKYDPDIIDPAMTDQPWMSDCLSAPTFPPPELSRPNSAPKN